MTDTALSGNSRNRHPVDQLADTRAEIKRLNAIETDLKAQISAEMGSADSLGGDQFIARQVLRERKGSLDEKAMIAAGIETEKFRKPTSTFIVLEVEPRVQEVV